MEFKKIVCRLNITGDDECGMAVQLEKRFVPKACLNPKGKLIVAIGWFALDVNGKFLAETNGGWLPYFFEFN